MLKIKRVYDSAEQNDGFRILVDRLWPRGLIREKAAIDLWYKDIAPTDVLRKEFGHIPEKFNFFKEKYSKELDNNPRTEEFLRLLREQLSKGGVTLVYGAKDEKHNQAAVLREYVLDIFNN